ncbi:MAG: fimbrillin family protein, partial [Muribaculaceae bacterium]|nr:fimbrillin family protein [Muribaculaceae bacterium]
MRRNINSITSVLLLTFGVASCANESVEPEAADTVGKVAMSFTFSHPSETRASETSFEEGDAVGLFVAESDSPLEVSGNALNNEHLTFSASGWNSGRKLYWDKGTYNAYAYYPAFDEISSVSDLQFSVATDQREIAGNNIDGYETSDFLYASSLGIEASPNPVNLQFRHILSKLTVRLIKGEDFEGEIPDNATVYI